MGKTECRARRGAFIVAMVAVSAGASNSPDATDRVDPDTFADDGVAAVLWSQVDDDSFTAYPSQNFERSFDVYDCQAADDFVVPKGEAWSVRKVRVEGVYGNGGGVAASENVTFYRSAGGAPGEEIASYPGLVGAPEGIYGASFLISLPRPVKLEAGRYWVSVQVNLDFTGGNLWHWELRATQVGRLAMWRNPGDGFGTGCTTYQPESTCLAFEGGPDHMFELLGKRKAGANASAPR